MKQLYEELSRRADGRPERRDPEWPPRSGEFGKQLRGLVEAFESIDIRLEVDRDNEGGYARFTRLAASPPSPEAAPAVRADAPGCAA